MVFVIIWLFVYTVSLCMKIKTNKPWLIVMKVYGTSDLIGSPSKMHSLLEAAAEIAPVQGNYMGSYLTFHSTDAFICMTLFDVTWQYLTINQDAAISMTLGSSTVFLDQSYWQRAIASDARSTTRAYFLGGLSWFSVPFAFGTTMGLSARALQSNPVFPTWVMPELRSSNF